MTLTLTLPETLPGWASVRVKFGVDRLSRLAGYTEQTDKHIRFYYIDYSDICHLKCTSFIVHYLCVCFIGYNWGWGVCVLLC